MAPTTREAPGRLAASTCSPSSLCARIPGFLPVRGRGPRAPGASPASPSEESFTSPFRRRLTESGPVETLRPLHCPRASQPRKRGVVIQGEAAVTGSPLPRASWTS